MTDVADLAATVAEGFETYRRWAPRGWDPPAPMIQLAGIRDRLTDHGVVCLLAEGRDGEPAGHVEYLPARDERGVAHLLMLFVRERWWGTGLASDLLRLATDGARGEGYGSMRLNTPAEHVRARRFYEREGWHVASAASYEPSLGLTLVTYRRSL